MNNIKEQYEEFEIKKYQKFILILAIFLGGLIIRLYYLPVEIPIILDGLEYFWYASDIAISSNLPQNYSPANNGWPIFLSFFFSLIDSKNFMDYMLIQRVVSVFLSSLTIIPMYFLCKKFVDDKFALLGSFIFSFEPRLILNSTLGITEPLFILLITLSILLLLSWKKSLYFLSIILLAFGTIVRSEGLILLIPFILIYGLKFKNKKISYEIPILLIMFFLIITPIMVYRIEVIGNDTLFSRIPIININSDNKIIDEETTQEKNNNYIEIFYRLGVGLSPIMIFLLPIGILNFSRKINFNKFTILTILFFILIPALYAISFLPDHRYLLIAFPILILISIFSIKKISVLNQRNIIYVILAVLLLSSISFLEYQKIDKNDELEILKISKTISEKSTMINNYPPQSGYLPIIGMQELVEFPILKEKFVENSGVRFCVKIQDCEFIKDLEGSNIDELIINAEKMKITHLIIDQQNDRRLEIFKKIYENENDYPFLKKIYQSKNDLSIYNVKIFEINYAEFFKLTGKD